MSHPTVTPVAAPNLVADTICRTAELGLSIDNAADAGDVTHLYCHPVTVDLSCPGCGQGCRVRDHVERRLTDLPIAGHPSVLHVRVPRLVCGNDDCNVAIFRASIPQAADDRQSVTRRVTRWILQRMATDGMSVKACARGLGIGWKKTCTLALSACRHLTGGDPGRLDHVRVLGRRRAQVEACSRRRHTGIRHRDRGSDPAGRRYWPGPTTGHGARQER